jgi:MYXO-CTERM domain-containing protein
MGLTAISSVANALTIARVTRHGYIMVDEPEAAVAYEGRAPQNNTQDTFSFIAEMTQLIADTPNAPRGRYLAVMQTTNEDQVLAYYLGISNDTRGIGQRSPINNRDEIYNLNPIAGTAFPLTGFVFLNTYQYYATEGTNEFGKYLICTQEFGHRFGTFVRTPPQPGMAPMPDAGSVDASADASDAEVSDAMPEDVVVDTPAPMDVANPPPGPDLMPTALLGRQTAHWSYFVHTGGSPVEGNNWNELMPGVFRTERPTFKFHPMDLYIMGLLEPRDVSPIFLIAEPDTMNQRERGGGRLNPASQPEYQGRTITIRGRRVNVTIDDIIRANGPRIPAAMTVPPSSNDAGAGDAGLSIRPGDLDVVWVLLTTRQRVGDYLVRDFDRAIESCSDGYAFATDGRSVLVPRVAPPIADSGVIVDAAETDATGSSDVRTDGGSDGGPAEFRVGGGCACRVTAPNPGTSNHYDQYRIRWILGALALATLSGRRRSERK